MMPRTPIKSMSRAVMMWKPQSLSWRMSESSMTWARIPAWMEELRIKF